MGESDATLTQAEIQTGIDKANEQTLKAIECEGILHMYVIPGPVIYMHFNHQVEGLLFQTKGEYPKAGFALFSHNIGTRSKICCLKRWSVF